MRARTTLRAEARQPWVLRRPQVKTHGAEPDALPVRVDLGVTAGVGCEFGGFGESAGVFGILASACAPRFVRRPATCGQRVRNGVDCRPPLAALST
jgi:hypothetical protein